ncbi:MAG: hypothetical protein COA43_06350 [Robiginitomaculum sp.]|nr:MAG: hypothetical protein COA43_06350 [Robiginitomaculum sp.]
MIYIGHFSNVDKRYVGRFDALLNNSKWAVGKRNKLSSVVKYLLNLTSMWTVKKLPFGYFIYQSLNDVLMRVVQNIWE